MESLVSVVVISRCETQADSHSPTEQALGPYWQVRLLSATLI